MEVPTKVRLSLRRKNQLIKKKNNFRKEKLDSVVVKLARKVTIKDTTMDQDEITTDNIYFGESDGEIPKLIIDMDKDDGQNAEECDYLKSELSIPVKCRQFKCVPVRLITRKIVTCRAI